MLENVEILANTDIAITRAWATSLTELESIFSQNDNYSAYMRISLIIYQYFNARFFQGKWEIMIEEKNLSDLKMRF